MTLRTAYAHGVKAAFARFKLAGPAGAEPGVMPKGDEVSHGTERIQYAKRDNNTADNDPSAWRADMPDWLWDHFTTYDQIAPGRADGSYGQEVIG